MPPGRHTAASSPASAPAGAITDVAGIEVGHFTDPRRPTGCTVILARERRGGRRRRARRRARHARDRPARARQPGAAGACRDAGRRQRLGPGRGRRRDALARGARRRPGRALRHACRSCRPRCCSTCRWATRASGPMPPPATRPARPHRSAAPAEGNVGAGSGALVGKLFGVAARDEGRHRHRLGHGRRRHGRRADRLQRARRRARPRHRAGGRRRAHRRRPRACSTRAAPCCAATCPSRCWPAPTPRSA